MGLDGNPAVMIPAVEDGLFLFHWVQNLVKCVCGGFYMLHDG